MPPKLKKSSAKELTSSETDDAMTIIAGLVARGLTGNAARLALIWVVSMFVQVALIICVGVHAKRLWYDEDTTDDDYVKPSCGSKYAQESADPSVCFNHDYIVRVGFYFAVGSFFWYVLQDQYSTSIPSMLLLMVTEGTCRWQVLCMLDALLTWVIFFVGVAWLSMTQSVDDIVLNCTALIFIAEVDDQCVKIAKKLGLGKRYLEKSASTTVFEALGARHQAAHEQGEEDDCRENTFFFVSLGCAICSLPMSAILGCSFLYFFGKQVPKEIDWAVIGTMFGLTTCVLGIFVIDALGKDDLTEAGDGYLFYNRRHADDVTDESGKDYESYDEDEGGDEEDGSVE